MPAPPNRLIRRAMLAAACATALTAASAHADPWTRSAPQRLTAAELGLSRDAAAPVLARAALRRSAARLGLARSAALALDPAPAPAGDGPQLLRFRQSLSGLRVLWSRIDVTVRAGAVQSISATTLPARRLSGARRLSADRARAIARRAGGGRAVAAELVAYAGEPGKPRVARRAYVVTVAPAHRAGDVEQTTSVVVDAGSGAILKRFAGSAARHRARPSARASATETVLYQIANYEKQPATNNYAYGKTDRLVKSTGNPYLFGTDMSFGLPYTVQDNGYDPNLNAMSANVLNTARYFCLTRNYCGRDGGQPGNSGHGDFNRLYLVGNWRDNGDADDSQYSRSDDHIMIGADDRNDPDVFAHEFGHLIDAHFQDDYLATFQSREVTEALADMFFIDAARRSVYLDGDSLGDGGSFSVDFSAENSSLKGPWHMNQYDCHTNDEHDNGTILSHAYWRFTQSPGIGHGTAGRILQYIPWALPAERTFGSVRRAFKTTARGLYPGPGPNGTGGTVEAAIDAAFAHDGVYDTTARNCPAPPPHGPPPICEIKPWLPQCNPVPTIPEPPIETD